MEKIVLKLYVLGTSPASRRAVRNLETFCRETFQPGSYEIEVVDIMENPDSAEESKILATPTLIREKPLPTRRIVGDLSDFDALLSSLEI
jgi:circadian clock protein KaiB